MPRSMTVSQCVDIAVDPATVYAAISDPTQTPRWSPENTGAIAGAEGSLPVGATFVGHNKRFAFRWCTRCTVTVAEPGRRFQFVVDHYGFGKPLLPVAVATWTYDLVEVDGGTRVIETWDDDRKRWPDGVAKAFDKVATRSSFAEFNKRNMRTTLDNLKAALEAA